MPSSTMRTAVVQATALYMLCLILDHHMSENIFDPIKNNEEWLNMMDAMNKSVRHSTTQNVPGRLTLDAGNTTNTSSLDHTAGLNNLKASNGTFDAIIETTELFYSRSLPRKAVICVVLCALQYWWLIWLERMFPARPRYKAVPSLREEKVEESEDREEEIVKKWIAQGRIRRASLNWCNTFLKWVLEMTVAKVAYFTVNHVLTALLKFQSPRTIFKGLGEHIAVSLFGAYISPEPFITLVSFVVVPAHRQIVFLAGADVVMIFFFNTILQAVATWAIKTEFAQMTMRNVTEHVSKLDKEL